MQLLAGVKLCTGRTLTNHPHFEDKALRDRTKELYQMYGKVCVGSCFYVDALQVFSPGQPLGSAQELEEVQHLLRDPRG